MIKTIKRTVRQIPWIMDPITRKRGRELDEFAARQEEHYRQRATELGLAYSEEDSRRRLTTRLEGRNIKRKTRGALHIFAAFTDDGWQNHYWPDPLQTFGDVTFYDWRKQGFHDGEVGWGADGRAILSARLIEKFREAHEAYPVDAFYGYLSAEIIDPWVLEAISEMGVFTFNVGLDDLAYAFRGRRPLSEPCMGTGGLASAFDLNTTSGQAACKMYLVEGGIPLYLPQCGNPVVNRPLDLERDLDVSFVGNAMGTRSMWLRGLGGRGVQVQTSGPGWSTGMIPYAKMVEVHSRSRINLGYAGNGDSSTMRCLKQRDFEVPMSGNFYLTGYSAELAAFYEVGREIACYHDLDDLVDKVHYYLSHPDEAEEIGRAGRVRALRDYTLEQRFGKILEFAGLL